MSESKTLLANNDHLPLRSPEEVDLNIFNAIKGPDDQGSLPVKDIKRLFHKMVVVDDETLLNAETIKVPGFIGISDQPQVSDAQGNTVSGYEDILKFIDKYGLLVCTYQYNKDRYGRVIDLRWPPNDQEQYELMEIFIKNEGHHSGAIIPAQRFTGEKIFASFNEPDSYHNGMYGSDGFLAVAQRLVFPEFVTPEQSRGYTDSIICWMALINPFVQFAANDFNGGDPTRVCDRPTLKEFLQNCALASLGFPEALEFFSRPENTAYCAEFIYISLNTPVYPFNKQGLTLLLDGDEAKALEILKLQENQNSRRENTLSFKSDNPQFKAFNIQMPLVPADLPPLDVLMAKHGQTIDPNSIPFPPFKLSQVLRRAFRTLLPRSNALNNSKIVQAQVKLFGYLEPLIMRQLGIGIPNPQPVPTPPVPIPAPVPANPPTFAKKAANYTPNTSPQPSPAPIPQADPEPQYDPRIPAIRQFMEDVKAQLQQHYDSDAEFDSTFDAIIEKADNLVGDSELKYFVPPRIYVDLGQNDGDENLPKGWGFHLETVGALIYRGAIKGTPQTAIETPQQLPQQSLNQDSQVITRQQANRLKL
ncbi:hypothetical protein CEN45_06480 [Fischerella thermalis CCMEE 5198]|jgi:hypothetical protein|uniref:hypothetical protein n=1 Tax=Fischerella thermalis TaxID=372787 RepID=UPI000C7FAFEE|nr:hypothetical protein [Fischerella thermalis]PMB00497.1 hypothetical protein CI594_10335 [Fischerella thermalis CCMEE 5196]PMB25225.1 hypothetical protein CEN45_06480 [Fischerella thermalis CCMEE 5198]